MKLSVIVPIYNYATLLPICLDSILRQGMPAGEMEVLLVNDGSTDNSEEVCRRYVEAHPGMMRLINKENGGMSSARNAGLAEAKGEYVHFIDSDDYIADGSYRYLFDNFLATDRPDFLGFSSVTLDAKARKWFKETNNPEGKSYLPEAPRISIAQADCFGHPASHSTGVSFSTATICGLTRTESSRKIHSSTCIFSCAIHGWSLPTVWCIVTSTMRDRS